MVYGSLPPEVRRRQADRFAEGETEICIATDAVGMGLNLPADVVCFYDVEKFDGKNDRRLYPSEVHQIGGRAGRYGMSTTGLIAAMSREDLAIIRELYAQEPAELAFARVAPTVDDLEMIPGSLAEQLTQWAELKSIPDELRAVITTSDMDERIELAKMLSDDEIERLGLASALQLVNAPTRKATRPYWQDCAYMILEGYQIPLPPDAPLADQRRRRPGRNRVLHRLRRHLSCGCRGGGNSPNSAKPTRRCGKNGASGRCRSTRRCGAN